MIYLDYQATTPLCPEAREAMIRWLGGPDSDTFGNPHSPHRMGRMAAAAIEAVREKVAALFPPGGTVIFTSGATEAINLAIKGTARGDGTNAIAVSAIEHAAVLDCGHAMRDTTEMLVLPVDAEGVVAADTPIPEGTQLTAVMQVNNEIGTIQPVEQLAEAAHAAGGYFLCDAVQGAGKLAPPRNADLIAVSAHKLYGPKGIGALWVRDGVELQPQMHGGGQEQGLRSGTLSPALIAGFGAAAQVARARMEEDTAHVEGLWHRARELFAGWTLNGSTEHRWHGNLNFRKDGLDVARLMSDCRRIMFSAGSACASGSGRPSHVLRALGLSDAEAKSSIRLGFGRYTSAEDIETAAAMIKTCAREQGL